MIVSGSLMLDNSHISDGYFNVKSTKPTKKKLKLRVLANGQSITYVYVSPAAFPLQFGDGQYTVELRENVAAKRYTLIGIAVFNVKLRNQLAPYLHPNQYVPYDINDPYVFAASALCEKHTTAAEKFEAIKDYIEKSFHYDFVKAVLTKKESLPEPHSAWTKKMGICQDLASLVAAMLRSQGVPAMLQVGYVGRDYHAWVCVYLDGFEIIYDPTAAVKHKKINTKYEVEKWY